MNLPEMAKGSIPEMAKPTGLNRRGFLKGLLAVPIVAAATKFLPKTAKALPLKTAVDSGDAFNTVKYVGNGASQEITGLGFKPDMVWVKSLNKPRGWQCHTIHDTVRNRKDIKFKDDGFEIGNGVSNNASDEYIAYPWKV